VLAARGGNEQPRHPRRLAFAAIESSARCAVTASRDVAEHAEIGKFLLDSAHRPAMVGFAYARSAVEAAKGNDAEAKLALAEARRLNPPLTIKWFSEAWPAARIAIDGLRKEGLPEE
jgi:hypothetical protein